MKTIQIAPGVEAIVDDEDYLYLTSFYWHIDGKGYVRRNDNTTNPRSTIRMHQQVLPPKEGFQIDHINRNKLDNRKCNLRHVTLNEQARNVGARKNNSSGHKGVGWFPRYNKWRAYITCEGKPRTLGYFNNVEDAVVARRKAEIEMFEL